MDTFKFDLNLPIDLGDLPMTTIDGREVIDYGRLQPEQILFIGAQALQQRHAALVVGKATRNDTLHATLAMEGTEGSLVVVAEGFIGDRAAAAEFARNTSIEGGKLQSVNEHCVDSGFVEYEASFRDGDRKITFDPDDPAGWPGGAGDDAVFKTDDGEWLSFWIGAATSGDFAAVDWELSETFNAATKRAVELYLKQSSDPRTALEALKQFASQFDPADDSSDDDKPASAPAASQPFIGHDAARQ